MTYEDSKGSGLAIRGGGEVRCVQAAGSRVRERQNGALWFGAIAVDAWHQYCLGSAEPLPGKQRLHVFPNCLKSGADEVWARLLLLRALGSTACDISQRARARRGRMRLGSSAPRDSTVASRVRRSLGSAQVIWEQ